LEEGVDTTTPGLGEASRVSLRADDAGVFDDMDVTGDGTGALVIAHSGSPTVRIATDGGVVAAGACGCAGRVGGGPMMGVGRSASATTCSRTEVTDLALAEGADTTPDLVEASTDSLRADGAGVPDDVEVAGAVVIANSGSSTVCVETGGRAVGASGCAGRAAEGATIGAAR
jgi:hypothetical protein